MAVAALTILIVDDHPLMSAALASVLREGKPTAACVIAHSGAMARRLLLLQPEIGLVILDLALPDTDGFELLVYLREHHPRLPAMVVSASESIEDIRRAFAAGARAYVVKSSPPATMLKAVLAVLRGEIDLPPVLLQASDQPSDTASGLLSERQLDVLRLVCAGKSNKVIAYELGLAEKTVKGRITAIFKALDVDNRTQALIRANQLGLFPAESG
ncbi:MAG: response regulator transcription factor [Xanthomonadales bacterium]|jgi:DNA-binding NarL/FixJ family response regulator|nr:response regulator transcription factor [Xanthomonadales bacterium]